MRGTGGLLPANKKFELTYKGRTAESESTPD